MPKFTVQVSELMRWDTHMPARDIIYSTAIVDDVKVVDATADDPADWILGANSLSAMFHLGGMSHMGHEEAEHWEPGCIDRLISALRGTVRPSAQPGHLSE